MNCKYESPIKVALSGVERIYATLSDFDSLGKILPHDKIKDWQTTADTCHFSIENVGQVGLRIVEREENATIKFAADEQTKIGFNLWIQMKGVAENESRIKVTFKADLNPMLKMMVGKQLDKFVDTLADSIARHAY